MVNSKNIPNPAFRHSKHTDSTIAKDNQSQNKKNESAIKSTGKYTYANLAIGKSSSRYIAIFKKITQGKFIIPSKQAGIFGLGWLIYRRASYYGFLVYALLILLSYELITTKAIFIPKAGQVITIFVITHIIFYFIGNFIYWYSVRQKIDSFRDKYGDTSAMTYLSEKGGTLSGFNLIATVIMLQGSTLLAVCSSIYIDDFMMQMWTGFLELAHL